MFALGPLEIALILLICASVSAWMLSFDTRAAIGGFLLGLILGPIGVAVALVISVLHRPRSTDS